MSRSRAYPVGVPDETDAFGRPLRGEEIDAFGAPIAPHSQPPPQWQAPVSATTWEPPVSAPTPAGWWHRVGAVILDSIVVGIFGAILGGVIAAATDADEDAGTAIAAAAGIVVIGLYYGLLMARGGSYNGQTWGKQLVGIRVIRADGAPIALGFALLREVIVKTLLFGYLALFTLYLATILNYLWPLWEPQNRALHDRMVRSRVIRT
jgi:uncharacterized RDD family membrane protein YckC